MNCNQATQMVEMKLAKNLALNERLKLWWHLTLCKACKQYEIQSLKIDALIKTHMQKCSDKPLDDTQLKKRIIENISAN